MGARTEVIYPARGSVLFDGGLDTKFEKSIIPDNESPDCLNVVFTNGAVATRPGTSKFNTTAVGSFVFDGLYTRRGDDNAETMIAFAGGSAWQLAGTTFSTIGSGQSVFTSGNRVAAALYRNNLFIGNGGVIPYKWNGSDFTRHGVYPLTNTLSAVCAGAGNIQSGTVSYKLTTLNSYSAESDLSTAAITLTVTASCTISLTSIPVSPQSHGVNSRRVYRYGPSNATYVLISTIADNTTTTYSDNTQTGTSTAPTDNGVPPKYNACMYHANRLFVNDSANGNYVWYSELGEPFTFPAVNFFKVGDAASDLVKGFAVYDTALVVFCENSIWLNLMGSSDDADWEQVRVRAPFGSKSPFGSWFYDGKVGFPAYQNTKFAGFAALKGDSVEQAATVLSAAIAGSPLISDKIETDMFDIVETYTPNISAMVFKNKAYIAVTKASGNTTNNRAYLYDFSSSNLAKSQKFSWVPLTGINPAQFTVYAGSLYYGSSAATGFIYKMETTSYVDDATAINSYYWTKEFSGQPGHENLPKDFRKIKILADLPGNYYMTLRWKVDSDDGVGQSKTLNLNPGATTWNSFSWGSASWGGGQSQYEFEITLAQTYGKRIQFRFDNQNTANQRFKVHRMSFTYNLRGYT
jgi:hypothetical protein